MSTHRCDVIRVEGLSKHPNADALDVLSVYGYTVCVRKGDFAEGDLAVYIEPDYVIDSNREEFAWLKGHERIKVKRLRGIMSQGLLVKAPTGMNLGDDAMEALGITRYEPPEPVSTGGEAIKGPEGFFPVYDVENWRRYRDVLHDGEPIYVSEKIHGSSGRYCWRDGKLHVGSRTEWKREDPKILWWRIARENPWIAEWCEAHQECALYGEVYGSVQDLRYGAKGGQVWFRVFDVLDKNRWLDWRELESFILPERRVPMLYVGPYDAAKIEQLSEGHSTIPGANHVREGCVIRPVIERTDPALGRVQLKVVSNSYLERA